MAWADHVDAPKAVRGASTGFTILVLGGLSAPVAAALIPVAGRYWLPLVAVIAFVVAACRGGEARSPWLHGLVAATSAYLLVLPLVLLGGGASLGQVLLTLATAVLVGAATGFVSGLRVARRAAAREVDPQMGVPGTPIPACSPRHPYARALGRVVPGEPSTCARRSRR
ncbi:hypothetical protein [Amycolatopsis echigonensis]|uniref:Uncharacterized protein n=2 Tax=Amycolatopsis echigonensis TaxID=2576905 RepID=A0A8E1W668_9PSEU|nr:hypothetical protein [Amycolatopsis echigonensis]